MLGFRPGKLYCPLPLVVVVWLTVLPNASFPVSVTVVPGITTVLELAGVRLAAVVVFGTR